VTLASRLSSSYFHADSKPSPADLARVSQSFSPRPDSADTKPSATQSLSAGCYDQASSHQYSDVTGSADVEMYPPDERSDTSIWRRCSSASLEEEVKPPAPVAFHRYSSAGKARSQAPSPTPLELGQPKKEEDDEAITDWGTMTDTQEDGRADGMPPPRFSLTKTREIEQRGETSVKLTMDEGGMAVESREGRSEWADRARSQAPSPAPLELEVPKKEEEYETSTDWGTMTDTEDGRPEEMPPPRFSLANSREIEQRRERSVTATTDGGGMADQSRDGRSQSVRSQSLAEQQCEGESEGEGEEADTCELSSDEGSLWNEATSEADMRKETVAGGRKGWTTAGVEKRQTRKIQNAASEADDAPLDKGTFGLPRHPPS
jgi:hypothetical protein